MANKISYFVPTNTLKFSDGDIKVYTVEAFEVLPPDRFLNATNKVYSFRQGVRLTSDTDSLLGSIGSGAYSVWILPVAKLKYLNGTTLEPATGVQTPIDQDNVTYVRCSQDELQKLVDANATRASLLTALKALTAYTETANTAGNPPGVYTPLSVAMIVQAPSATASLTNLHYEVYGLS